MKSPKEESGDDDELTGQLMQLLIELRAEARKNKDFATADRIRNSLTEMGDHPRRPPWRHRLVPRLTKVAVRSANERRTSGGVLPPSER